MQIPKVSESNSLCVGNMVKVVWVDAVCGPLGWIETKDLPPLETFETIGYVVKVDKLMVCLSQSIKASSEQTADTDTFDIQGIICIPVACVLEVKELKCTENRELLDGA